jgi:hypothetical protein
MRTAGVWLLSITGSVGLLAALSVHGGGGGASTPQLGGPIHVEPLVWRVGLPDGWLGWERPGYLLGQESRPNVHFAGVRVLTWSFGILGASVCALGCAALLDRRGQSGRIGAEPGVAADRRPVGWFSGSAPRGGGR